MSVVFIAASAIVLFTPGPTNTLMAASGATIGVRKALPLPFAEGTAYAIAIGVYLEISHHLASVAYARPLLNAVAATWLLISAAKLWRQPAADARAGAGSMLWRVFATTLLNPKAMLVGTTLIPTMMADRTAVAVVCFAALSVAAGFVWLGMGSLAPAKVKRNANKAAALVLALFAAIAMSSAVAG